MELVIKISPEQSQVQPPPFLLLLLCLPLLFLPVVEWFHKKNFCSLYRLYVWSLYWLYVCSLYWLYVWSLFWLYVWSLYRLYVWSLYRLYVWSLHRLWQQNSMQASHLLVVGSFRSFFHHFVLSVKVDGSRWAGVLGTENSKPLQCACSIQKQPRICEFLGPILPFFIQFLQLVIFRTGHSHPVATVFEQTLLHQVENDFAQGGHWHQPT